MRGRAAPPTSSRTCWAKRRNPNTWARKKPLPVVPQVPLVLWRHPAHSQRGVQPQHLACGRVGGGSALVVVGAFLVLSPSTLVDNVELGTAPTWTQVLLAIPIGMLAYTGIETVSNMAEEAKDETRTIPQAISRRPSMSSSDAFARAKTMWCCWAHKASKPLR